MGLFCWSSPGYRCNLWPSPLRASPAEWGILREGTHCDLAWFSAEKLSGRTPLSSRAQRWRAQWGIVPRAVSCGWRPHAGSRRGQSGLLAGALQRKHGLHAHLRCFPAVENVVLSKTLWQYPGKPATWFQLQRFKAISSFSLHKIINPWGMAQKNPARALSWETGRWLQGARIFLYKDYLFTRLFTLGTIK